jgi:hypothetical protein
MFLCFLMWIKQAWNIGRLLQKSNILKKTHNCVSLYCLIVVKICIKCYYLPFFVQYSIIFDEFFFIVENIFLLFQNYFQQHYSLKFHFNKCFKAVLEKPLSSKTEIRILLQIHKNMSFLLQYSKNYFHFLFYQNLLESIWVFWSTYSQFWICWCNHLFLENKAFYFVNIFLVVQIIYLKVQYFPQSGEILVWRQIFGLRG